MKSGHAAKRRNALKGVIAKKNGRHEHLVIWLPPRDSNPDMLIQSQLV